MAGAGLIGIFFINIQKIWVRWDNKLQQLSRNDPFDYSRLSRSAGEAAGPGAPLPFPQQRYSSVPSKLRSPGSELSSATEPRSGGGRREVLQLI